MRKTAAFLLTFVILFQSMLNIGLLSAASADNSNYYTQISCDRWYAVTEERFEIDNGQLTVDHLPVNAGSAVLKKESTLAFSFTAPSDGDYYILPSYRAAKKVMAVDTYFDIKVNGKEISMGQLPILWYDTERHIKDRNGDERVASQSAVSEYVASPVLDYYDVSRDILLFAMTRGETYHFEITSMVQDIEVQSIAVCLKNTQKDRNVSSAESGRLDPVIIEAEDYAIKSDSYIRAKSVKNVALSPYNTYHSVMNVLDGVTFGTSGQKAIWEFDVKKSGWYKMGFICQQNEQTNKSVYRKIEIDGDVPYSSWNNIKINYTGSSGYKNVPVSGNDGEEYVFLAKGRHTVALTVTAGEYEEIYNSIKKLMEDINALGQALLRLTAGATDPDRTWNIDTFMPDAVDKLEEYADRADEIFELLAGLDGKNPIYATDLKTVSEKLRKISKEPMKIPNKTEEIYRGDSSAAKYLGNVLTAITNHGMSIDRIVFYTDESDVPSARPQFIKSLWESVKRFVWSFLPEASEKSNNGTGNKDELVVWTGQSSLMLDTVQQAVDEGYNRKYGKNIKLTVMPSEQKLVLANAAGKSPDVVLSVSPGLIYTFAVRNAAKNLLEYKDFLSFYNSEYQIESLLSTSFGDGVYGAVDSRNFQLLFYRKDIMNSLGISIPDTWDDVRTIMPTLLRNQMNFYIPVSTPASLKGLGVTTPYIYQNGGEIYSTHGNAVEIDSPQSIAALNEITEFYRIYGMQTTVSNFYNSFRYGEIPIGIGDFNFYMQLSIAAPELAGQWGVALTPGTKQEDGSVLRYQPANSTGCMIFENTDKPEEAWQFLKWWLSKETQLEYSTRRSLTFGTEYQWNTANIEAFEELPFDSEVKAVALEQWRYQREVTPHPAAYIVERQISAVWNDVVIDNTSIIESIDRAVLTCDREITKKLQEFGYVDSDGKLIRDYNINIIENLYKRLREE